MRILYFSLCLMILGSACTQKAAFPMDREWMLSIMNGKKMSGDNAFKLKFDEANKGYSGKACNTYRGSYQMDKSKLTFGTAAATKMMCPNMDMETEYFTTLASVDGYKYSGTNLVLTAGGKDVLLYK